VPPARLSVDHELLPLGWLIIWLVMSEVVHPPPQSLQRLQVLCRSKAPPGGWRHRVPGIAEGSSRSGQPPDAAAERSRARCLRSQERCCGSSPRGKSCIVLGALHDLMIRLVSEAAYRKRAFLL
jgi:hypothetical protein